MANTAIATIENFNLPAGVGFSQLDSAEFEGVELSFPRVRMPAGGGTAWELPNPDDPNDPIVQKTLEGVIVYHHPACAYWVDPDADNSAPDCESDDGMTGYGNPGGPCGVCPLNQFGSGEGGKGKMCKNMRNIYLLRDGDMIPLLIALSPTSLKPFREYANALMFAGRMPSGVKTQISLKKQEGNGNTYSVAVFRMAGALKPELAKQSREYAAGFRELVKQMHAQARGTASGVPVNVNPETGEIGKAADEDY